MYQIIRWYILNLHNIIRQSYPNKDGKNKVKKRKVKYIWQLVLKSKKHPMKFRKKQKKRSLSPLVVNIRQIQFMSQKKKIYELKMTELPLFPVLKITAYI